MLKAILAAGVAALLPLHDGAGTPVPPKPLLVTITTVDYAFEAPASIEAGTVTLRLVNRGKELHHIWVMKLERGKTIADLETAMKKPGAPPPPWAIDVGGPNAPVPGATAEATLTLEPGNYALVCVIPSPDGVPHFMKGMVKALTVKTSERGVSEPSANLTMKLTDYDFALSRPITAGRQVIRIENVADQSHEVLIAKLLPGKTAADVTKWAEKMQGPPPAIAVGGATGVKKGRHMYVTATFEPGKYALVCFVQDAKDGKPHFVHGMTKDIVVQ